MHLVRTYNIIFHYNLLRISLSAVTLSVPPKVTGVFIRVVFTKVPTLTISWTPITDFDYDISYTVWYSTSSGTTTEPPSGALNVSGITGTSTTLSGLAHGTTYYIWVAAISSVGEGPFSTRLSKRMYKGIT